jgi:hypothetical protein
MYFLAKPYLEKFVVRLSLIVFILCIIVPVLIISIVMIIKFKSKDDSNFYLFETIYIGILNIILVIIVIWSWYFLKKIIKKYSSQIYVSKEILSDLKIQMFFFTIFSFIHVIFLILSVLFEIIKNHNNNDDDDETFKTLSRVFYFVEVVGGIWVLVCTRVYFNVFYFIFLL